MDVEYVRSLFGYDPETGLLTWAKPRPRIVVGQRAGSLHPSGYRNVVIDGRSFKEHRIIWLIVHGVWPSVHIDHANGKGDDNRICNLREATRSQNLANSRRRKDNTAGLKGVSRSPIKGKWMANINHNGVRHYLGSHPTKESAHAAYQRKATELFGSFARTN